MPATPSKRRKKTETTPHNGKTLDFFFKSKANEAPQSPRRKSDSTAELPNSRPLTDEEIARQLAKQWAEEDQAVENGGEAKHGEKRPRSSSEESFKVQDAADKPNASTKPPTTLEPESKETATDLQNPSDGTVSLEAEDETRKMIDTIPFDSDTLKFNPDDYSHLQETWPNGKATYALLVRAFVLVNSTRSRIKIVDTLVNFLRTLICLDPDSLLPAVWLATNDIGPPYENNELGIGSSLITKSITRTSGITPAALKKLYHKHGDAGDVAFEAKAKQKTLGMRKPRPLTIQNIYHTLHRISTTTGKGSQDLKESHLKRLLVDARGEEIRYLTRTFLQHLRIGAVKTTMLICLARAFTLTRPPDTTYPLPPVPTEKSARTATFLAAEETLKQTFARRPNYNDIVPVLLRGGVGALETDCPIALHIPLKPMLGLITRDLDEMLNKLAGREFSCEYKYDGQRAQIHCDTNGKVSIFSRHLERMTDKYPDLVALIPEIRGPGVHDFMLEGEVVAISPRDGTIQPFQTLAGRGRTNIALAEVTVTVCLFAFDLMYLNGTPLLNAPFRHRRSQLRTHFHPIPNRFAFVPSLETNSSHAPEIRAFFTAALAAHCEGIMTKLLDPPPADSTARNPLPATYTPDLRTLAWLKVKSDYTSLGRTLDLLPIAAWHGNGRKAAFWSPLLLAARDPDSGSLIPVCKIISGISDSLYKDLNARFAERMLAERPGWVECPAGVRPTVWIEPAEVWEVAFADVTLSPVYLGGAEGLGGERGLSLRFPRLVRERADKGVEEASTVGELVRCWEMQRGGGGTSGEKGEEAGVEEEVEDEMEDSKTGGQESDEADGGGLD